MKPVVLVVAVADEVGAATGGSACACVVAINEHMQHANANPMLIMEP